MRIITPPAAGGGVSAGWDPFASPSSESETDVFNGSTLDPKWTQWDESPRMTLSTSVDGRLNIVNAGKAGATLEWCGALQPAPVDDDWHITGHISIQSLPGSIWSGFGVIVGQDLLTNPDTERFMTAYWQSYTGEPRMVVGRWTRWNLISLDVNIQRPYLAPPMFARIAVDRITETFTFLFSQDGERWLQQGLPLTWASQTFTSIDTIGIGCFSSFNLGDDVEMGSRLFDLVKTTDVYTPTGARS